MVQGKKLNDVTNGSTKYKDTQSTMAFQRKDSAKQNGNAGSFRTDSAISGTKAQGERTLQRWIPEGPEVVDMSLEASARGPKSGGWDQFEENERRFGLKTDFDENIYTTKIDTSHPLYKQRLAMADKKAREIERSTATNSHVAEERIRDNLATDDKGGDEEDKYSGVRRQDFPPLSSSNNKYTPPARRPPTGQATVAGAPVDPAIISSQLARPDKSAAEKSKATPTSKALKPEVITPPTTTETSITATPEVKATPAATPPISTSRTSSPQVKSDAVPNATATVERDVASAFKGFAAQQRRNVNEIQRAKASKDKEIKLNDLKKFADSFKLHTPVPSDLVSIIAKDPAKQKEIQEKAKRNAEEAKANPVEPAKTAKPAVESKPIQRPAPSSQATAPANANNRQNVGSRPPGTNHQGAYPQQQFRQDRPPQTQQFPTQNRSQPGGLTARLRNIEQNKLSQNNLNSATAHEARLPPSGPSSTGDPNYSRRSSAVSSARLNPNSNEFRPSAFAPAFNPNGNPSTGSSPRSAVQAVEHNSSPPASRSLLRRKPVAESDRPKIATKFNALDHVKTIKPAPEKNWKANGDLKPAYDTPPTWRQLAADEKLESTMHLTYTKLFEMSPFPNQAMSPPNPSHAIPQAHQHQLPFHLQQGVHMGSRQSPRQPQMNLHGGQHGHAPNQSFNGPDDHRMMPSHSAQSFHSPRLQNVPMAFPSPMNQSAQLAYTPQMIPYPGAPPMTQYRSLSQSHQFIPPQGHMGPVMMQNPANGFMAAQGMPPGPPMMYPQGAQGHFMPHGNGHPPAIPGVNGYPSPGRSAPMMMSQGSQQGHQQHMYSVSPGQQYGGTAPIYTHQPPGQAPMRGYGGHNNQNHYGSSPQQPHGYGGYRNNHANGNYHNSKNFQQHGQHNGPPNNPVPAGPQARVSEAAEEPK